LQKLQQTARNNGRKRELDEKEAEEEQARPK
jgi:hypothetical protein